MEAAKFVNHCHHEPETFVGSFVHEGKAYDVYVYADYYEGASLCIRYGNEDYEYISAGKILRAAQRSYGYYPLYEKAIDLIIEKGKLRWTANK